MTTQEQTPPEKTHVTIPIETQHIDRVTELWQERFGAPEDQIHRWTASSINEEKPTECFVASSGGSVLGFGIACFADPDYVENYINHPDVQLDVWPRTGIIHMICVDEDYESQGLGTELTESLIKWLTIEGCQGIIGVSWHRENQHDSRAIFQKQGFNTVAAIDDFYESAPDDTYCIDCDDACTCGATIFRRDLTTEHETQP